MIVEIHGVSFSNKGAELMLHAVVKQMSVLYEDAIVVANLRYGDFQQRSEAELQHLAWAEYKRVPFAGPVIDAAASLIPGKLRHSLHLVRNAEVQAVLDASGFAYSDQWGEYRSKAMARKTEKCKKEGRKVILLPQAFGPFEDACIRDCVLRILDNVSLVFARDRVSYDHLIGLGGRSSHVMMAPDFTNLVVGQVPEYWDAGLERPCIIPNYRMIDKTAQNVKTSYVSFLVLCMKYLMDQGMEPFILIHETNRDYEIAAILQDRLGKQVPIIQESSAVRIKGILGSCSLVVSSRYHALVSALSQGIPCLATGWSHKYLMLLEDYGCPECLVSKLNCERRTIDKLEMITQGPGRLEIKGRLGKASLEQKELTQNMWAEVYKVLAS